MSPTAMITISKAHLSTSQSQKTHTNTSSSNCYKRPSLSSIKLKYWSSSLPFLLQSVPLYTEMSMSLTQSRPSRRRNNPVQILRLKRRFSKKARKEKRRKKKMVEQQQKKMLFKNLELYLENQNIIQENEKLREKAALLIKENKSLYSQLQNLSQHHTPSQ